ncbi:unnamed protein product [Cercopithifilaria johnstoni]|uniref:SXP/RAL-2 family protein Ani s 5-like cation-binding domain-containing protein n=1 Tax=Cercopithifilaria johnstoni TaxID=2874296 RepID=A0A8J2MK67_9BILA|nr:unnamed protein product [Cercopithifilaria johnstoni]
MKFVLFVLPIILLICTVYGSNEPFIIPPFLLGAPESVMREMQELLQEYADKPDYQMERAVEEWVKAKGGMIKVKYDQFKANMQQLHNKATLLRKTMAQNLSKEAKKADMELINIGRNKSLSAQQKKKKFEAYLMNLSQAVRNELQTVFYAKF